MVEIAQNTFSNLRYAAAASAKAGVKSGETGYGTKITSPTFSEIVLPAAVPVINALPTLELKGSKTSIKVKILGSWQKIHYDVTNYEASKPFSYAEGSLYFGYQDYVEGALEVANALRFKSTSSTSPDKRDLTVSKADLTEIVKALKGVTPPITGLTNGFELEIGHEMVWSVKEAKDLVFVSMKTIPAEITLTLGDDAFAADGLAKEFTSFFIGHNVGGDLGTAGFAKLRNKDAATTFTLDLSQANFKKDKSGLLSTNGDALFAKNSDKDFTLSLILNSALIVGKDEGTISEWKGSGPTPIQTIGKDWFKGTTLTLSAGPGTPGEYFRDVTSIGHSAFKDATVSFDLNTHKNSIIPSFPNVTAINDSAFANTTFTSPNQSFLSLSKLSALKTIGKDVFSGTQISLGANEPTAVITNDDDTKAIPLPFKSLTSAPANVFNKAKFMYGSTPSEFSLKNLKIEEGIKPAAGINPDAFKDFTTYVDYNDFTAWSQALSTDVKYYGFTQIGNENGKDYIRVLDKNGRDKSSNGKFSPSHGFTESRTLSFGDAENLGIYFYSISGLPIDGFTTGGIAEIGDLFETGIDLTSLNLPAGLWIVQLFNDREGKSLKASELIEVLPQLLENLTAIPIPITWNGGTDSLKKALTNFSLDQIFILQGDVKKSASDLGLKPSVAIDDTLAKAKVGQLHTDTVLLKLTASGNLTGTLPVPVEYKKLSLAEGKVVIDPVPFLLQGKTFEAKNITVNSIPVKTEAAEAWVEVKYLSTYSSIGPVKVKLIGQGALTDSVETEYQITADWASKAVIDPEIGYGLGGTVTYKGKAFGDFKGLVYPPLLNEEDYEVVAIKATETVTTLAGKDTFTEIAGTGTYDFYLIPTADKYGDAAAYVGSLTIDKLPLDSLTKAAIVTKTGDSSFDLSFNEKVFAGDFDVVLDEDVFTVTLSKEQVASISGLEELTFEIGIPTGDPEDLEVRYPFAYGEDKEERLYILVGDEFDLSTIVFAVGKAKVDFREGLVYKSNKPSKLEVTEEGGILTALDEWNGIITVSYLDEDFNKTATAEILVSAVYEEDLPERTGNDVIADASKAISYAGGALTVKGFAGTTVAVYSLNGATIATAPVLSNDAILPLGLNKGFYLVKVGSSVTKIVVHQ